jgi:hypothetical protein
MSAFDTALQTLRDIADTHKATAIAEQSRVSDQLIADVSHFLANVRQARMMWEREFAEEH